MEPRDRLESPITATLLFGGVFLLAFLANLAQTAVSLSNEGIAPAAEPGARAMLLGWLGFALSTGCGVAFVRRRIGRPDRKNLATGVVVGACYAAACFVTFGRKMPLGAGAVALVLGVWAGTAYAVTSGLNEVMQR